MALEELVTLENGETINIYDFDFYQKHGTRNRLSIFIRDKEKNIIAIEGGLSLEDLSDLNKKKFGRVSYLNLTSSSNIYDYSFIKYLRNTLKRLWLGENKNLASLDFLEGCDVLKTLDLSGIKSLSDYSGLRHVANHLVSLSLKNNTLFKNLEILKPFLFLEQSSLDGTSITSLFGLLDHDYVLNGSLKEISLPSSIDWLEVKDHNYVNGWIVQELKRRGVEVKQPGNFFYKPIFYKEDEIRSLLSRAGIDFDVFYDKIVAFQAEHEEKGGFSSALVLSSDSHVAKVASKKYVDNERRLYNLLEDSDFVFMPSLIDSVDIDSVSLMILDNVNSSSSGFSKSGLFDPVLHNLYVMGLFHKVASQKAEEQQIIFPDVIYETLQGEMHYDAIHIPFSGFSNGRLSDFRSDVDPNLSKLLAPVVSDSLDYISERGDSVVHGDWKLANTENGYIFDFGITHKGSELEDVAYFLTDYAYNQGLEWEFNMLQQYINLRSKHDNEFAEDVAKHEEFMKMYPLVRAKELSVRISVRRKRDYTPSNRLIRQNYNSMIKEGLRLV